jgi:hypothetical protein
MLRPLCAVGLVLALLAAVKLAPASPNERTRADVPVPLVKAGILDWLFGGGSRREERMERPDPRSRPDFPWQRDGEDDERSGERGTWSGGYRTLCVRLCDGFFFPISHSTHRGRFARDAEQCEKSCPGRGRLFVHRSSGQDVEDMADLQGKRYRDLPAAFVYQTQHVADCTCRGNPWDEEALARHRAYAEAAKAQPPKAETQLKAEASGDRRRARAQPRDLPQSGVGYRSRRLPRDDDDD